MGAVIYLDSRAKYNGYSLVEPGKDHLAQRTKILRYLNNLQAEVNQKTLWTAIAGGRVYNPDNVEFSADMKAIVPDSMYPTTLILARGRGLNDYNGGVYSQKFRDAVEEIDPGVHQFVPVDVFRRNGEVVPGGPYYQFRIQRVLNSINFVGATKLYPVSPDTTMMGDLSIYHMPTGSTFSVFADRVGDAGAWVDLRCPRHTFVSDRLLARLRQGKVTGWAVESTFTGA